MTRRRQDFRVFPLAFVEIGIIFSERLILWGKPVLDFAQAGHAYLCESRYRYVPACSGNDTVNNNGTVNGTVDLGTGANAFNNNPGATFNPGALVNLGAGNALTNEGILEPGGSETALEMILNGDLVQAAAGILEIEIGGFTPGTFDFIDITGTANLTGGNINFSFLPDYDIASEITPGQSMTLQFLNAGYIESFASAISYGFLGSPVGFRYGVFQEDNGLYFKATNAIPAPGAFLLVCIGLGCIRGTLRRTRQSAPRS